MTSTIHLEVITPDGIILEEEVDEVMIPTSDGQITVLPHHVALYSKLVEGEMHIKKNNKVTLMAVLGGIVEVGKTHVRILSDYAVRAENIQLAHAEEAKKRAEEALKNKESESDFALAGRELQKSILELKIAQKIKRRQI